MKLRLPKIILALALTILGAAALSHPAHAQQQTNASSQANFNQALNNNFNQNPLGQFSSSNQNVSFVPQTTNTTGPTTANVPAVNTVSAKPNQSQPASPPPPGSCGVTDLFIPTMDCVSYATSYVVNIVLGMAAFVLDICGNILNIAMILTLHIKDFVDATPAIYAVWQTMRDITGLFFIFFLLFAAFQMILEEDTKFGQTLKNIVVAGILINFSFFIVSVGIDASNIVSMAIYTQMLPNSDVSITAPGQNGQPASLTAIVQNTETKSGISNIFMNSLQISKLYDPNANKGNGGVASPDNSVLSPFRIILIGVAGVAMMIATSFSFVVAAGAFIIRLGILIFLLAFSPLIFVTSVIPQLKEHTKKLHEYLYSQLIFMPIYLLLMYVALSVLNKSNLIGAAFASNASLPTGTNWTFPFVVLSINFTLVIFILNLPLVAGIGMSGSMTGAIKKFDAKSVWKQVGGFAGRHTVGRTASYFNEKAAGSRFFGGTTLGRDITSGTVGKLAGAKMGTSRSFEDLKKANKESAKALKGISRREMLEDMIIRNKPPVKGPDGKDITVSALVGQLKDAEMANLDKGILLDPRVVQHLSKSQRDAIKKSDDISDEDKAAISEARKEAFNKAVKSADPVTNPASSKASLKVVEDMMKKSDASEIADMDAAALTNPAVLANLNPEQLKKILDSSNLSNDEMKKIATIIKKWHMPSALGGYEEYSKGKRHRAFNYMNKPENAAEWGI